jgi:cytochrome c-type biogenesis protein CcmH/NrfG
MGRRRTEARKQKLAGRLGGGTPVPTLDPIETMIAQSRRARAKGDIRRAVVLLRQACALDEWGARTWTLLGALLARQGAIPEAERAFRHACWLRRRAGDGARATVTEGLARRLVAEAA